MTRPYICSYCGYQAWVLDLAFLHIENFHSKEISSDYIDPYFCPFIRCTFNSKRLDALIHHYFSHEHAPCRCGHRECQCPNRENRLSEIMICEPLGRVRPVTYSWQPTSKCRATAPVPQHVAEMTSNPKFLNDTGRLQQETTARFSETPRKTTWTKEFSNPLPLDYSLGGSLKYETG